MAGRTTTATARRALLWLALAAATAAMVAWAESECCSTCIGKTSSTAYTYDPVIYDQCTNVTDGICCFDCGSLGEPVYGDAVSYASDGTTAVAETGTQITFTWSDIVNVTYVVLKAGQKKTVTPTISDTAAAESDGTFSFCATSAGTIYFRGWGEDTCRKASPEKSITIEEGDSTTCSTGSKTSTDDTGSSSASASGSSSNVDASVESCNANRGSVQEVDGVQTCVCVSDWTNPPECDQWPVWKWVVTIGGGVAAFLSILLSVRAFLKSREKKRLEERDSNEPPPILQKDGIETLQVTPSREYKHEPLAMAMPYKRDSDVDYLPPAQKNDHREFAL